MKKTTRDLAKEFMQYIQQRRNSISLTPFCEQEWFRGAYSTIQMPFHGNSLDCKDKKECAKVLTKSLLSLKKKTFDKEVSSLITKLSNRFHISIGEAQKIVSIFCKYAFCVFHTEPEELPEKWVSFVKRHQNNFLVPIDTIVLFSLKNKKDFKGFIKAWRSKKQNGCNSYSAYIMVCGVKTPWSKLSCLGTYWCIQKQIRRLAKIRKMRPLKYEMHDLWRASSQK
jgi:hypothetical protein